MVDDIEELILSGKCPPLVVKNKIESWPARKWTPTYLASELMDKNVTCKLAPKSKTAQWETECNHETVTLQQFVDWNEGTLKGDNPLCSYDMDEFSCYIDYKYMKDMFDGRPELLKGVDWSVCGLPGRDGYESTVWVGSQGCYTNCHYDTYGFNLVAQIYGRKRWVLFPPADTRYMYPTRLPYEESSVFSQVDVKNPDIKQLCQFKNSSPHVVDLEPGDILFVPRHWWHYVESLETSISINTWIQLDDDRESQLTEAITRVLVGCLMADNEENESVENLINPWELENSHTLFSYLQNAYQQLRENKSQMNENLIKFASHLTNDIKRILSQNKDTSEGSLKNSSSLVGTSRNSDDDDRNTEGKETSDGHSDLNEIGKVQELIFNDQNVLEGERLPLNKQYDVNDAELPCKRKFIEIEDETVKKLKTLSESKCVCNLLNCEELGSAINLLTPMTFDQFQTKVLDNWTNFNGSNSEDRKPYLCLTCLSAQRCQPESKQHKQINDVEQETGCSRTEKGLDLKTFISCVIHPEVVNKIKDLILNQT